MSAQTSLRAAVARSEAVYDLALEVSTLLADLAALDPMPPLAFSLRCYTQRVTDAADGLHGDLLRLLEASKVEGESS